MKIGQTSHSFETVVAHSAWEEMKVTVEQSPNDEEPTIELEISIERARPERVKMTLTELNAVNKIVEQYQNSQKAMKNDN